MKASTQDLANAWYQALKEVDQSKWSEVSEKMLKTLQETGQLTKLTRIVELVKELEEAEIGKKQAVVTVAHETSKEEIEPLVKELTGAKEVEVTVNVDKELIGGMIVQTKNTQWDLSVKNQVNKLYAKLNR